MIAAPLLVQAFRQPQQLATFSSAEWELLLRQATIAQLTTALYYVAEQYDLLDRIPARARDHLAWAHTQGERHAQGVRFELREIRRALAGLDLPLILLKGAAYAAAKLPPAPGRLFSDIDIMVPKERLGEVEAALMMQGWVSNHLDEYDQRYYREWMHELPPMEHVKRQSLIDVHHAILPETAAARPDPATLRAAAIALDGGDGWHVLAPMDMVLHSAVHLFYDGEFDHGLRDLVDIHRLLPHFGADPAFWHQLPDRARQLQLERPLFYALRYAGALLGSPVPPELLDALRPAAPNRLLLKLMDLLFRRALLPRHPSCSDRLTHGALFLLYVRSNWLRMPPLMLARHLFHKAFISPKEAMGAQA